MPTQEIDAPKWGAFCDEFSRLHRGTTAFVEVIGDDIGAQEEARELPFVGISYDPKGSERGSISILLGTEPEDHEEHRIEHPKRVWLRIEGTEQKNAVDIEDADNIKTILQLKPIPALPK